MSCGPIPVPDRVAKYCGYEKHQLGQPLPVAFNLNGHVSANWVEYFGDDLAASLDLIRSTCGLTLGAKGAFPVIPVESLYSAIKDAGAIPDVQHNEENGNVSHAAIAWVPRNPIVDRMVVLRLSQQQWDPRPLAREGDSTPDEWPQD